MAEEMVQLQSLQLPSHLLPCSHLLEGEGGGKGGERENELILIQCAFE